MTKESSIRTLTKEDLLSLVKNTYDDAQFLIGQVTQSELTFADEKQTVSSKFISKQELLNLVSSSTFTDILRRDTYLQEELFLSPSMYVWSKSITHNQIYHTGASDGYLLLSDSYNPHYHIYYHVDIENNQISLLLGEKKQTFPVYHAGGFVHKLRKGKFYTGSLEHFERHLKNEFWSGNNVRLLRCLLDILEDI